MLFRMGICLMPTWDSLDQRECAFCGVPGDGSSDGPGRLLNLDVDKWVHLNCALWTDEVYETTSGALVKVDEKHKENAKFKCSLCERPGASVHCFKLRCTNFYHLGCATKAGCVFYKNKTVFCQSHAQRSERENELTTLCVFRRVYVDRDEERQIAGMMHLNDSDNYLLRVGSLIFMEIGQLLPQQLQNPTFHTRDCVYPVGYKAVSGKSCSKSSNRVLIV
jgi:histone-lysine N-methyltransferase MLL3